MSRTRFFDFRAPDSTDLFRNRLRAIIQSGVYLGYSVGTGGSGGLYLKFTHNLDPDNLLAGLYLGKLVTPDGVMVSEDEQTQDDIVVGSMSAGTPNVHYVVASYTYNQALPNNDVAYAVRQGTAGSPPTPPTLGDDEVLLAEIDIPNGATAYTDAGVDIKSVAKLDLYDISDFLLFQKFEGLLDSGIYDGMEATQGSSDLLIDLAAGAWLTNESFLVREAADQSDLFTLTDPNAGNYSLAWIIGMHKAENTDPVPEVDYLLVQGSAVALGSEAVLPNDTTILAAAAAVDAKYDDASYINKLGIVRVKNDSGYFINYIKGTTILDPDTLHVYGGEENDFNRSGKYFGHEGLLQAIADIYAKSSIREDEPRSYTLLLDGEFKLSSTLHLPSHVSLKGNGAPAKLYGEFLTTVKIRGKAVEYDNSNPVLSSMAAVGSPTYTVPAGYTAREYTIAATYQTGDDLETLLLSYGDTFKLYSPSAPGEAEGIVAKVTGAWVIEVLLPTAYVNDANLDFVILKNSCGVYDIEIGADSSNQGRFSVSHAERCDISVRAKNYRQTYLLNSHIRHLTVTSGLIWGDASLVESFADITPARGGNNRYDMIVDEGTGDHSFFEHEQNSSVGFIVKAGGDALMYGKAINIQTVSGNVRFYNPDDVVIQYMVGTVTNSIGNMGKWKVLYLHGDDKANNFLESLNQDRNMRIIGDGKVSWNATTGVLGITTDHLWVDLPTSTGYNRIPLSAGWILSNDGDRGTFKIYREATGTGTDATNFTTYTKANAGSLHKRPDIIIFGVRYGDDVVLFDGTRVEDGFEIKLGQTPPPDGSISYPKLAESAVAFHNEFFRDYVVAGNDNFVDEFVFLNTAGDTLTYTIGTGVVSGYTAGSLAVAKNLFDSGIPLTALFPLVNWPTHGAQAREQVLAVTTSGGGDSITVQKGLTLAGLLGSTEKWNGALLRGNVVLSNHGTTLVTYTPNTGVITFSPATNFTQYQVQIGFVFVDNNGNKFPILARDTSGNGVTITIPKNLREVFVGVPSGEGCRIETNNNPYDISMGDLRCLTGLEFLPVDIYGGVDIESDDRLMRLPYTSDFEGYELRFSQPYDKRIRLRCTRVRTSSLDVNEPNDASTNNRLNYGAGQVNILEFTGVCTGAALVVGGGGGNLTKDMWVDGQNIPSAATFHDGDYDNTYSMRPERYEIAFDQDEHPIMMTQGLHHFAWVVDPFSVVKGVVVFNAPNLQVSPLAEAPGTLVRKGEVVEFNQAQRTGAFPTPGSGWDKGGRGIRYLDTNNDSQWATNFVRNFTGTADSPGSNTLTNVTNPNDWRVGDLVMMLVSNVKYIRRITSISGNSIVCAGAVWPAATATTIYYYGKMRSGTDAHRDPTEEHVQQLNIKEFAAPGRGDNNRGACGTTDVRTNNIGVWLSDLATGISANESGGWKNDKGRLASAANSDELRFMFVGTGLSLDLVDGGADLTITVDGVPQTIATTEIREEQDGYFICGELPYCSHIVTIETNAAGSPALYITGGTVWQLTKPDFDGFELMDTGLVGVSDSGLGLNVPNGVEVPRMGIIRQDAGSLAHFRQAGGGGDLFDTVLSFNNSMIGRVFGITSSVVGDAIFIVFYGNEITIVSDAVLSSAFLIHFLDADNNFETPSLLTGWSLDEGGDTIAVHTTSGKRDKWVFEETAVYVMKISCNGAASNINIDTIEVHCPFHAHRTKAPVGLDHFLPMQHAGIDKRNESPFNHMRIASPHLQHAQDVWLQAQAQAYTDEQKLFCFYTLGGETEIEVTSEIQDSTMAAANLSWWIEIDNAQDGPPGSAIYQSGWGTTNVVSSVTVKRKLSLAPGYHFARLISDSTSDYVRHTKWSARSLEPYPNGTPSRGLAKPGYGPVNPGDFGI